MVVLRTIKLFLLGLILQGIHIVRVGGISLLIYGLKEHRKETMEALDADYFTDFSGSIPTWLYSELSSYFSWV